MLDSALSIFRMQQNQWKSRSEIESIQEEKLLSLVSHALLNVPHYKKTLTRISSIHDLHMLPTISKQDLRNPEQFICTGQKKDDLIRFKTSGSTGLALETFATPRERAYRLALYRHRFIESGFHPFDLMARVVYKPSDNVFSGKFGLYRTRFVSMFQDDRKILEELSKPKPQIIRSYPGTLAILAKANLDYGLQIPKAFSSAAVLSENARKMIKESFGADVRNIFGAVETGPIAFECEKGNLHLHSDSIIAEVVDDSGLPVPAGKTGSLVLTPLWLRTMPLIRYNIADQVSMATNCSCGRGSHVIKAIGGRTDPLLAMKSGKLATSVSFDIYVRTFPGIVAFQALQNEAGKCILSIVPDREFSESSIPKLKKTLESTFPESFEIEIRTVESIKPDASGKIPSVKSTIKHEF